MDIPGWSKAVSDIRSTLDKNPELATKARNLAHLYADKRGIMIVDVVASRQRRYTSYVVPKILPLYEAKAKDLSIASLAAQAPSWLPLRHGEAETMQSVANALLSFGIKNKITDENELSKKWAMDEIAASEILDIHGIGPALMQYMRMLCGADSLKVDVRVQNSLEAVGLPVSWFTADGVLSLCKQLSKDIGCSLLELDQALWHVISKKPNN